MKRAETGARAAATVDVAVTVDDLPIHGPLPPGLDRVALAERMIAAFRRHHLPPVYGFVNGKHVVEEPASEAVLRRWIEAGNPLANHTYSHVSLNAVSLPDYFADLERNEDILRRLQPDQSVWKVFRYPFLFEGDTTEKREGARRYLRDHGYVPAEVTIDAADWSFNPLFVRCAERGDTAAMARVHGTFVDVHVDELGRMRELVHRLVQREVRHVLLLHIGAADADAIEDLLVAYEGAGVHWIDLPTALGDPFYQLDPGVPFPFGAAFPYLLAKVRKVSLPPATAPRDVERQLEHICR